jgi:hypothetical protein
MSLSNLIVKQSYQGNGATTTFSITQDIIANDSSEIKVYIRDETDPANITETLMVEGALQDYTLTGASPPSQPFDDTVLFSVAPTATQQVWIVRELPLTQTQDIDPNVGIPAETTEKTLDKIVGLVQQLDEKLDRVPYLALTSPTPGSALQLPEPEPDEIIGWNSTGTGLENKTIVTAGGGINGSPASTDNAVVRWDGTSGNTVQDSNVIINDADEISGVTKLDVDNIEIDGNTISSTDTDGDINLTPNGDGEIVSPHITMGVGTGLTPTFWGSNPVPGIVIDGTTPEALLAFAAGIVIKGDDTTMNGLIVTQDRSDNLPTASLWIRSGINTGDAQTGDTNFGSGDNRSATFPTGNVLVESGPNPLGPTGNIFIRAGNGVNAASMGSIFLRGLVVDFNSKRAVSVADPTSAQDAATKNYVDTKLYSSANDNATGANASLTLPATRVVRLTNASLVSVDMIPAGSAGQFVIIENKTTVTITVNNETGATPANRILTGTGAGLSLLADASILVSYDTTSSRWHIVGGSGGGAAYTADGNGIELSAGQFALELDGSTLSKSATGVKVAALGVTASEIAANAVITAKILDANVTNAKLADMAQSTIKGRAAGAGTGVPVDLTATQATAILNEYTGDSGSGGLKGLVKAPASGDAAAGKYLHADGTWKTVSGNTIAGGGLKGYFVDGVSSPSETIVNATPFLAFGFDSADPESYYYKIIVPDSFVAGNRIKLSAGQFYAGYTSGSGEKILFISVTRLVKPGDDATAFARSAYTSTNTQVAGTTANVLRPIGDLYLSDGSGLIGSANPAAGDTLIVQLKRNVASESPSYAGDAYLLKDSFNINFAG